MSHTKRSFIQSVLIRSLPKIESAHEAIGYGERLWDELSRRGYGGKQADTIPRERADWYGRLGDSQRAAFDRFWKAYDYKHGRNEAAMVWGQIQPEPDEIPWIVSSARLESQNWRNSPPQGQTRIYAQGWLTGYRWRDHPPPGAADDARKGPSGNVLLSALHGQLASLKRLHENAPNETLARQIADLESKLHG